MTVLEKARNLKKEIVDLKKQISKKNKQISNIKKKCQHDWGKTTHHVWEWFNWEYWGLWEIENRWVRMCKTCKRKEVRKQKSSDEANRHSDLRPRHYINGTPKHVSPD